MKKQLIVGAVKYGVGFSLLAWVVWRNWRPAGGLGIAEALERPMHPVPLVITALICAPAVLLTFVRWYFLVRAVELPFTLPNALRLGLVGYFFNMFLPGSIGGDVIKAAVLAREQSRRTVAVATVLIDRVVGLWGLFWLVALVGGGFWACGNEAIRTNPKLQSILVVDVALVAATVLVWFLLGFLPEYRAVRFAGRLERIPKVGHSLAELWRAVWMYRCKRATIALALLLSLVAQVGFVLIFYFAGQVFYEAGDGRPPLPSLGEHFLIIPIGMVVQAFVPLPGGVGFGELSFGALYGMLAPTEALRPALNACGVMASLVQRMISWGLALIGYLVYLRMRPSLPADSEDAAVADGEARLAAMNSPG